ncbi:MAG: hypothetical protein CM1200mP38_7080 [Dehalococcoidia bacterium]|nr:MAG: hypothetical protein CM1200mP38_7080 [Dehalococcoidia bacterium]
MDSLATNDGNYFSHSFGKNFVPKVAVLSLLGMFGIAIMNLWDPTMVTLAIMFVSVFISVLIGVPLGVIAPEAT